MGYTSSSDVAALVPHITSNASDFTASTNPTLTEVNAWITTGCGIIEATIGQRGYGAIPANSPAYSIAAAANAYWAAYNCEISLISARVDRMENTRDMRFWRAYQAQIDLLMKLDLSVLGVSRSRSISKPYAGGISQSDKDANYDGDTVGGRFRRGQFRNQESTEIPGTSSDPTIGS